MGVGVLTDRVAGQTILDTFFNDIHSALDGDFVGRNSSGVATSGQNLGSAAIPWGTLRATSIILNSVAVDTSQITSQVNRVVSGKVRSSSNQPAFITPNGAAASFILAGSTTNLVLDINGTAVTVTTDITTTGVTLAPSSANTAVVNDADATGTADTRLWGVDGHKKVITIGTVGSNITNLVGSYAAFKISTEVFIAKVESSTTLTNCRRGYFYDSTLTPLNRVVFSNSATITLLKIGYVFVENNATTVNVSYTTPVISDQSPTSPVTGDYWYDLLNSTWKRYDGATFQIINRTLVGMIVSDATNCIAARTEPFFKNYDDLNSTVLEVSTTSIVRTTTTHQRVSVAGNKIEFKNSRPTWNITTAQLVATPDSYSASEAASTYYYVYVKDTGAAVISDIEPIYFPEFFGEYHPHNPWRCIGDFFNDGSSNIVRAGSESNGYQTTFKARTWSANGAVATAIDRYSVFDILGTGVDLQDSANSGTTPIIRKRGMYSMNASRAGATNAASGCALTRNETQTTTAISGATWDATVLDGTFGNVIAASRSTSMTAGWDGECFIGDIIRVHNDTDTPGQPTWCRLTISKNGFDHIH